MANVIKSYDYNYFIIIVSQYQWEQFFSEELGEVLSNCGALNIKEFANYFSPRYGNKTTIYNIFDTRPFIPHNLYHPYAFVGIPGLTPGKAFEILRPNQGFYKSLGDQPYAELRIILRYSSLLGMYTFDLLHQHHVGNHFNNLDPDLIFRNVDFSLRKTLPKIMNADIPSVYNFRTSIYVPAMEHVFYSNTSAGNNTESERVFLMPG